MSLLTDHPSLGTAQAVAVIAAAVRLLTKRTGAEVTLVEVEDLGGTGQTVVVRARVGENPFSLPRTIVVKQSPAHDSLEKFAREVVSYQFTTSLATGDRPGPELLAWDLDERVLIISDLGEAALMSQVLASSSGGTENALMAWAQRLGRMHAATAGREIDFAALLRRAKVPPSRDVIGQQVQGAVLALPKQLREHLSVDVPDEVRSAATKARELFDKGTMRAFSPADPGPDNILLTADQGVRFLDYEWGGFRDAALDIAYALVTYRGSMRKEQSKEYWSQLDQRIVQAWRAEAVTAWPFLADEATLLRRVLAAELVWVWLTTAWWLPGHGREGAWSHGHALSTPTPQALLARWEGLLGLAEASGDSAVTEHAETVIAALRAAWRW
ncbi:MAG: phosphotransferase family protein [Segniliparus sp.]|uniref:phosphotransferase family protein n=1 Tax=Segniliparus sp. TaxID=2804064 RepID=UPI003F368F9D